MKNVLILFMSIIILGSYASAKKYKYESNILINGGTFSVSRILSSNLESSPKSIIFGLALIQPHYKTDTEGHGILPDIEIEPTIHDRKNGIDPELKWVLDEIKG